MKVRLNSILFYWNEICFSRSKLFLLFLGEKNSLNLGSQWEQFSLPTSITGLSLSILIKSFLYAWAFIVKYWFNPKLSWYWVFIITLFFLDCYFEFNGGKSFSSNLNGSGFSASISFSQSACNRFTRWIVASSLPACSFSSLSIIDSINFLLSGSVSVWLIIFARV